MPQPEFMKLTKTNWDEVDEYFQCISECDLDDKECTTVCVQTLRESSEN